MPKFVRYLGRNGKLIGLGHVRTSMTLVQTRTTHAHGWGRDWLLSNAQSVLMQRDLAPQDHNHPLQHASLITGGNAVVLRQHVSERDLQAPPLSERSLNEVFHCSDRLGGYRIELEPVLLLKGRSVYRRLT
jgi:hypothetical protein